MRLILSVSLFIRYSTVEASELGQCSVKNKKECAVRLFNWEEPELVQDRVERGMSPLNVPAIAIDYLGASRVEKSNFAYYDKMILDTGSALSRYHPIGCRNNPYRSVEVGLGLGGAYVDAKKDCNEPYRAGRVGIGPSSPFMNRVYKLELTIRGRKYTDVRVGAALKDDSGYTFADIVTDDRYPEAWTVEGIIMKKGGGEKRVKIIFRTRSTPDLIVDTEVSTLLIPRLSHKKAAPRRGESFSLRGDQFFHIDDDTIVVNPIVLGSCKDVAILFDSGSRSRQPRMGFKSLPKHT